MPPLKNAKHEKYVQNLVKGMTQRIAYKDAFKVDYADNAIDNRASELFNTGEVQGRYRELMEKIEKDTIMSAKDRMDWLSKVVYGDIKEEYKMLDKESGEYLTLEKEADINTKIKAIDTLNKMSGEYIEKLKLSGDADEPFKVEIEVVK